MRRLSRPFSARSRVPVVELVARLRARFGKEPRLIIAPYLSPAVRERLREASVGFLDLTGNARIELREPGLFIEGDGADIDPDRQASPSRSLRGVKAGRIVRLLVDSQEPPGVRQIAEQADVDPGYVSRVLGLLDHEALIERQGRGRAIGKSGVQHALDAQEIEYLGAPPLAKRRPGQWWQYLKRPRGQKYAVGDQRMDVRVEGDERSLRSCTYRTKAGCPTGTMALNPVFRNPATR